MRFSSLTREARGVLFWGTGSFVAFLALCALLAKFPIVGVWLTIAFFLAVGWACFLAGAWLAMNWRDWL